MKKILATFCVASLLTVGCNSSPTGGRDTSKGTTGASGGAGHASKKETFTLKGPTLATHVKQGASEKFTISISRGSDFKDNVALKATSSEPKVHVTLEPSEFRGSEKKDVEATIKADDDAKIGEAQITITGTPESGSATELVVKIDVTAKEKNK